MERRRRVKAVVRKWGNSASVRIPAAVLDAARIGLDQPVDVREEGGRIVIEPLYPAVYDLAVLLDAITDDNRHAEVDTGSPAGREVW